LASNLSFFEENNGFEERVYEMYKGNHETIEIVKPRSSPNIRD